MSIAGHQQVQNGRIRPRWVKNLLGRQLVQHTVSSGCAELRKADDLHLMNRAA